MLKIAVETIIQRTVMNEVKQKLSEKQEVIKKGIPRLYTLPFNFFCFFLYCIYVINIKHTIGTAQAVKQT